MLHRDIVRATLIGLGPLALLFLLWLFGLMAFYAHEDAAEQQNTSAPPITSNSVHRPSRTVDPPQRTE